jgi:crotonobetainyl-CoA:carnitine CoA-transferase CaiB-like acyl-CoA transferase
MGAEVIKVESPGGDESRSNGPYVRGQSAYWVQYNSGKKSLGLNMRTDKGKEIVRELVKVSDILIQNFRPGTIDKMGFSYDTLRSLNKGIIMVNVSAYGQYGPYRDQVGFDPIGQAISGMMMLNGFEGMPPIRGYNPVIDRITSLHATIGALSALYERHFTGEGQCVDVCLADSGYTMTEIQMSAYLGAGIVTKREGNGRGTSNVYQTKDGWVLIAAASDNIWPRFCQVIGAPEWATDPRFAAKREREKNSEVMEERLKKWFLGHTTADTVAKLGPLGIPVNAVNDVPAAAKDPHLLARELLVEVPDPVAGKMYVSGKNIKLSRSEIVVGTTPVPGQHTRDILTRVLKYSDADVERLESEGVVYTPSAKERATASD